MTLPLATEVPTATVPPESLVAISAALSSPWTKVDDDCGRLLPRFEYRLTDESAALLVSLLVERGWRVVLEYRDYYGTKVLDGLRVWRTRLPSPA